MDVSVIQDAFKQIKIDVEILKKQSRLKANCLMTQNVL